MNELISEQLPNDGGHYLTQLIKNANRELKQKGEHGKTCQLKRSGNSITLQFNFEGQENKGCGCRFTQKGIERAYEIAQLVTIQLRANNFTLDWYKRLIGKPKAVSPSPQKELSFLEIFADYKKDWLKNSTAKYPIKQWKAAHLYLEKIALEFGDRVFDESTLKKIIEQSPSNSCSRKNTLNGLTNFCDYCEKESFLKIIEKYRKNNKPRNQNKYVPDDREIEFIYQHNFDPDLCPQKKWKYRVYQWQFLYGLLAVYGLRIHEAWNIANWDTSVTIKEGDWIVFDTLSDNEEEIQLQRQGKKLIVPAILDTDNDKKILCIKHNTKTGYRMAMPLSPYQKNWLEQFNLISKFNIPDIPNPLKIDEKNTSFYCSSNACRWFKSHQYGFTPHALRHAYNHRGHELGYNPTLLAQSLGHNLQMNSTTYLRGINDRRKFEGFEMALDNQIKKQDELEHLRIENIQLKAKIEILETKLALIEKERSGNI